MKKQYLILLIVIYLAFIALGLPDALLGSAWNLVREDFSVSLGMLSIMSFAIYLMSLTATYNAPRLLRLFQTKKITFISICFTGFALIFISFVSEFYQIIFFAIPLGLGAGAIDVSLNHYVANNYKSKHMNFLHSFYGVGVTLGPFIMAMTLRNDTWRDGFLIVGLILLVIALLVLLSFKLWHKEDTVKRNESHAHISLFEMLKTRKVISSISIFLIYVHIESLAGIWIASYFYIEKSVSYATAALFTTVFYLALTIGRFISGFISSKVSSQRLVIIGEIMIITSSFLLVINNFDNLYLYFSIVFLLGLGCAPIFPNMIFLNNSVFEKNKLSKIISLQMAVGYLGFGVLTPLAGILFDLFNISFYPLLLLFLSVLTLVITVSYLNLKKNKKSSSI
jgi:fucose permease